MQTVAKKKSSALAARIRELREAAEISQSAAARELGIGRQTYIRYENGDSAPTFADVCKLAALFGVEVTAFKCEIE
jgi:transcriptional regulator with XRE-family HTH domain